MTDFLIGLGAGAVVVALQAGAILLYARRVEDLRWHLVPFALCLAIPLVLALRLLDAADAGLGLITAEILLVTLTPEFTELVRPPDAAPPSRHHVRRTLWLARGMQLLCVSLALDTVIRHDDWLGAAPAAAMVLAFERVARYVARL